MTNKNKSIFEQRNQNTVTVNDPTMLGISAAGDAANSGTGITLAAPTTNTMVYMGGQAGKGPLGGQGYTPYAPGVGTVKSQQKAYVTYGEAVLAPAQSWSQSQIANFVNQGIINKVQGFDVGMGMPQIQAAWQKMVDASVLFNQGLKSGQKPWTPMDVMNSWSDNKGKFGTTTQDGWKIDIATGERLSYVGAKSRTSTATQLDLSSAEQVEVIAKSALQQALGRNPNAKELAQFKSTISGFEREHPQTTTTTETATADSIAAAQSGGGSVFAGGDTSSTTTGGVTDAERAGLVSSAAEKTPEYAKYQAANYFQMLLGMIGGS